MAQQFGGHATEMSTVSQSLHYYQPQADQQQPQSIPDVQGDRASPYNQYSHHQLELQQLLFRDRVQPTIVQNRPQACGEFRCTLPPNSTDVQQVATGDVGIIVTGQNTASPGHNPSGAENDTGIENGNGQTVSSKRHRSKHRPLFRRLFNYIRNTISGQTNKGDQAECEEYELPPRYRPDSVRSLCQVTRFTEAEVKRLYRGFKAECPSGMVREETFKIIYSQFFSAKANTGNYAHFVFNTLDQDNSGIINFEDFLTTLSILSRGSLEEKLTWTFALYDINGDGYVTREEMTDIVTSIYEMVDKESNKVDEEKIKEKVDHIFQKMDANQDGVVTLDEFIACCRNDEIITDSMTIFDNIIL